MVKLRRHIFGNHYVLNPVDGNHNSSDIMFLYLGIFAKLTLKYVHNLF